ncbi:MAG: hypothetical protein M3445_00255, partial [Actinomycetota bacterium]|nr:hypothetical protein [Actinomycetota bacterium]
DGTGTPKPLALGYAPDVLPSFVTPAAKVEDLRIAHTSCRKSNGPATDALAWLDVRVKDGLTNLDIAPQQLYLTGDQIYADDVGAVLLPMLADIGKDIIGTEKLTVGNTDLDVTVANFPAMRRQRTVRKLGRLTTTDGHSHLLGYGEFVAMYCAAFSPAVWRDLPTPASLFLAPPDNAAATFATPWENAYGGSTDEWKNKIHKEDKKSQLDRTTEEGKLIEAWRDAVPKVARALANVSTYMIFDDHEITDDWNITDRWRRNVVSTRFGRAVLRNGLMAYTVFQAWGNDPLRFLYNHLLDAQGNPVVVTESQRHANDKLLDRIKDVTAEVGAPTGVTYDKIDKELGIDKPASAPTVDFHYEVQGPLFTVRALDSRTRRTFKANDRHAPPKLLGDSMDSQVPKGPLVDGRELLIVIAPAPVLFPRLIESVAQPLAALVFDLKTHMFGREDDTDPGKVTGLTGAENKDIEGWRAVEEHHEALLRRLGTYRRVVVLSGDVHFAGTLTLDFWGKDDETLDARIVQCTASASRNQPGATERGILRTLRLGQQLLRGTPIERIAWEGQPGVVLPAGAKIAPSRRARLLRKPSVLPARGWPGGTTVNGKPDWRWRLELVRDERPRGELPAGAPDIPELNWNAGDKLASIADLAGKHQQVALDPKDPLRLMVFRNNLGLVSFSKDGADYRVSHALLSSADGDTGDAFTKHTVPFAPVPLPVAPVLRTD